MPSSLPYFHQQVFVELLLFARHCVETSEEKGGSIPVLKEVFLGTRKEAVR